MMKNFVFVCLLFAITAHGAEIEKIFLYNKYTLEDNYLYKKKERSFQWDTINHKLDSLQKFISQNERFAVLINYKNWRGNAPLATDTTTDEYGAIVDRYGVPKSQSIPLYNDNIVDRYAKDGSLVAIVDSTGGRYFIQHPSIEGIWSVPKKYVQILSAKDFKKVIFVDRKNQNIASLELVDTIWVVRSMNPATTGLHKPPYQRPTPLGIFVMQSKLPKMVYYKDGTKEIGGYAPYANRFCCGGYIHGVPVNLPQTAIIEYSTTLGTTPRSHMCVRNATSHAKFIYDWTTIYETLIYVIE